MEIELESVTSLRFVDGAPVRAASAVAPLAGGLLVVQDDAAHAAWWSGGQATSVRIVPPVEGLDVFGDATGTKHLKPDLEAACSVTVAGGPAVLLLGSGSGPRRMRAVLVRPGHPVPVAGSPADLTELYVRVAAALEVDLEQLNLEGACVVGNVLRWWQRGRPEAGLPTGSVDVDLGALLAAVRGSGHTYDVGVRGARTHDLGSFEGVGLGITDAVTLAHSDAASVLVSAAAEDTDDPREDGPVVGSVLALLEHSGAVRTVELPRVAGRVAKVEGLCLLDQQTAGARVLAVVDADDPEAPSLALHLRVRW